MTGERDTFDTDFAFVCDSLSRFFEQPVVQRKLDLIAEVEITGWEKWWQVEFVAWLSDHDQISEWVMEERFFTDLRKSTEKDSIAIDVGFRRRGFAKDKFLFIELKQNTEWRRCIDNMLKDAKKVYSAQSTSKDGGVRIRNFFVACLYPTDDVAKKVGVRDYVQGRAEEWEIEIDRGHVFSKYIANTPFSLTVF